MQGYSRIASPRFRRITIRFIFIEIELRARPQAPQERISFEERAFRRARAEEALECRRNSGRLIWSPKV
jgi:hypothetical protein